MELIILALVLLIIAIGFITIKIYTLHERQKSDFMCLKKHYSDLSDRVKSIENKSVKQPPPPKGKTNATK